MEGVSLIPALPQKQEPKNSAAALEGRRGKNARLLVPGLGRWGFPSLPLIQIRGDFLGLAPKRGRGTSRSWHSSSSSRHAFTRSWPDGASLLDGRMDGETSWARL